MSTGSRIKEIRKKNKLTQDELAKKVGISKNGLWNYENDKREISIELIQKIADTFNVPLSDLIEEENPIRKTQKEIEKLKSIIFDLTIKSAEQTNIFDSLLNELIDNPENEEIKEKLALAEEESNKIDNFILSVERNLEESEMKLKTLLSKADTFEEFGDFYTDKKEEIEGEYLLKELNSIRDKNQKNRLIKIYEKLNRTGKEEAVKRVDELTQIKKYTRDETIVINYEETE